MLRVTEKADYAGSCCKCGGRIYTGDIIIRLMDGSTPVAMHAECDPDLKVGGSKDPNK